MSLLPGSLEHHWRCSGSQTHTDGWLGITDFYLCTFQEGGLCTYQSRGGDGQAALEGHVPGQVGSVWGGGGQHIANADWADVLGGKTRFLDGCVGSYNLGWYVRKESWGRWCIGDVPNWWRRALQRWQWCSNLDTATSYREVSGTVGLERSSKGAKRSSLGSHHKDTARESVAGHHLWNYHIIDALTISRKLKINEHRTGSVVKCGCHGISHLADW